MKAGGTGYKKKPRRDNPVLGEFLSHKKGLERLRRQFLNRHINIVQTEYYIKDRQNLQSKGRIIKIITRII